MTNTRGESSAKLIRALSEQDVNVNVTAIMTEEQIAIVARAPEPTVLPATCPSSPVASPTRAVTRSR